MLTKEEILENWNMFVGSQATNYGEDLIRNHDELWVQERVRICTWEHRYPGLSLHGIRSIRSHASDWRTDWCIAALPHRLMTVVPNTHFTLCFLWVVEELLCPGGMSCYRFLQLMLSLLIQNCFFFLKQSYDDAWTYTSCAYFCLVSINWNKHSIYLEFELNFIL